MPLFIFDSLFLISSPKPQL